MNRKFLLLVSLLIIAIGATGILSGYGDSNKKEGELIKPNIEKEIAIVLAQATHDLPSGSLLTKMDYSIKKSAVPQSSKLIKDDISATPNIDSYLLKHNILAGSYITQDMLVSPDSDEFNYHNLQQGQIVYKFNIKQQDEYLLDTLQIGDVVSFQLRALEIDNNKGMENGTVIENYSMNNRKKQSYSLNEIITDVKIIRIKKHSERELSEKKHNNQKTENVSVGYIDVIIKTEELDVLHIVEKSGDIFLTPSYKSDDKESRARNLYDVIPKLRTTRELRG
ncbi:tight adherance operon protein [Yersinia rohdei]|uniref:tight adherance operon protein n=1 Tax=Yersinia rohdei TaxID=29485 RepID=UPI0016437344|nr:tight adherance operon protein [Yersinia rohdei]